MNTRILRCWIQISSRISAIYLACGWNETEKLLKYEMTNFQGWYTYCIRGIDIIYDKKIIKIWRRWIQISGEIQATRNYLAINILACISYQDDKRKQVGDIIGTTFFKSQFRLFFYLNVSTPLLECKVFAQTREI